MDFCWSSFFFTANRKPQDVQAEEASCVGSCAGVRPIGIYLSWAWTWGVEAEEPWPSHEMLTVFHYTAASPDVEPEKPEGGLTRRGGSVSSQWGTVGGGINSRDQVWRPWYKTSIRLRWNLRSYEHVHNYWWWKCSAWAGWFFRVVLSLVQSVIISKHNKSFAF